LREGGTLKLDVGGRATMADEIVKLDELRQKGLITEEEYKKGKSKILSK
jgi:hypothetical protein